MTDLSDKELDIIATPKGDECRHALPASFHSSPVVFFGRDGRGVVKFVTVLRDAPVGSASVCKWDGDLV